MRKVTKKYYWETGVGLSESDMKFDLARSIAAVSRSRDFQQMNETEIARKRKKYCKQS